MGLRSPKVIETGAIRKLGCGFLFAFHNNCMALSCIVYEIQQLIGRNSRNFYTQPVFSAL